MSNNTSTQEDNLLSALKYKYVPFWPLFVILFSIAIAGAWAYLQYYAVPSYRSSATLIIKDEKKGVNDSRMTESIDAFISNKIVENEIKVIQSNTILQKVVDELDLYAPVFEEEQFKSIPAYVTSPIRVKLKYPDIAEEHPQIYFTYDESTSQVTIGNRRYSLNEWINTPYGIMKFTVNEHKNAIPTNPLFFSIIPPKKVVTELFNKLNIEAENKLSSVVNLKLDDSSPERGEDILTALISIYNQVAVSERNKLAENTLEFVENRISSVEKELNELESQIVQFKSTRGATNLSEQGRLYLQNVGDNDRKISEINSKLAILSTIESYVVSKNKTTGIVPSTLGADDPVLSHLLDKLYNSEIQYEKLKTTTAENNPVLTALKEEIGKIRPSILENIRNQRNSLLASRSNLSATNSQYNSALQSIPQKERELMEISREQAIKNNAYGFLLQKREETVLSYAPSAGDSRILDIASSTMYPVSPKPLYAYLIAIALASIIGIGIVTGKELMNTKLLFRSEIESFTNAPIVAEIAFVKKDRSHHFVAPKEASVIEQFRQMRTTLGLYGRVFTKKKIMVTSSIPSEGKSYISSNLALSLASSGKKVALLDFDLRNPNSSQLFDQLENKGLIEYLKGELALKDIIYTTPFTNLSIAPAGVKVGDHTELLLNGRLEQLFEHLEEQFDYIVLDTPPIELVTDAYLISEYCDITLLVMRHAFTPKNLVQRLAQSNKIKALQKVAIVFNGVKPRGFVKGQYGYGYGYGYDFKYDDKTYRPSRIVANT